MNEVCTDGRFEMIAACKKRIMKATNIDRSPAEMAVIDNILFRFWQMNWLPQQQERKKGRWETIEGWDGDALYRCSECGTEFVLLDGTPEENDYHFCPNCGADMRREKHEAN